MAAPQDICLRLAVSSKRGHRLLVDSKTMFPPRFERILGQSGKT